jgi:CHAT domain-containing protein
MGDFEGALVQYAMAVDTLIVLNGAQHPSVSIGYRSMANVMLMQAEYDTAIRLFNKALDIQLAMLPPAHPLHLTIYKDLGECYFNTGNLDLAMDYYTLALEMAILLFGPESYDAARFHLLMAGISIQQNKMSLADAQLKNALNITESIYGPESGQVEEIIAAYTLLYMLQGDADLALGFALRSLEVNLKIRPVHPATAHSHTEVGKLMTMSGNYNDGLTHFNSALAILDQSYSSVHPEIALVWFEIGRMHRISQQPQLALEALSEAFDQLRNDQGMLDIHPLIVRIYTERLKISGRSAELILEDVNDGMESVDRLIDSYRSPGTLAYWIETTSPFYYASLDAVYAMFLTDPSDDLFLLGLQVAERSKSALLRRHIRVREVFIKKGIPDSLFYRDLKLKKEIRFYTALLSDFNYREEQSKLMLWRDRLRTSRASYLELQERISDEFPKYQTSMNRAGRFNLENIRQELRDQALLEYVETENSIYTLALTDTKIAWFHTSLDSTLEANIKFVKNTIRNPNSLSGSFAQRAYAVYEELLEPALNTLEHASLLLIPDGELLTMPFDILCTSESSSDIWSDLPYLLLSQKLHYLHNLEGLLMHNRGNFRRPYVGFAPSYSSEEVGSTRSLFGDLPFARQEVEAGNQIWDGEIYLDSAATKQAFLSRAGGSQILHLAMHTELNPNAPALSRLLFQDSDSSYALHTYEIYDLHLQNQLVILSACETGLGEYHRGEGVLSLAHAFRYAGVPAIAMSLWKVSDQATKVIITDYLRQLKLGLNKSQSLQIAKTNYLSASDQIRAHPYYWAAIVHVGNNDPIRSSHVFFYYLFGALGIFIIGIILIQRVMAKR